MHIFSDFDGTISVKDTTDEILTRFASPEWELIEAAWKRGEIGSAQCMREQIALVRASKAELDAALDEQKIDQGFAGFRDFCKNKNIPLTVISDGVDYFIKRILQRHELNNLPVIANTFHIKPDGYALTSNYSNPNCEFGFGVCKCKQLAAARGLRVFIGDGRSDFCAVHKADVVFAKGTLAKYCEGQGIAYYSFENFTEILHAIKTQQTDLNQGEYRVEYA